MTKFTADTEYPIEIPCDEFMLDGLLHIPSKANGLIIFAHGSGSSRLSPRNQYVANVLQKSGKATLLFDLLTADEEQEDAITSAYRFDIALLADRLDAATKWVLHNPVLQKFPLGYFGASTGAAAALVSAARFTDIIKAIVSRGGRPDLAGESLAHVNAPTLLIVGSLDEVVIDLNKQAMKKLKGEKKLELILGATHLFEEHGALEIVATLASAWFADKL